MICTKNRLRLCYTLLLTNLVFIWGNSLLPGSISGALSDWLKNLLSSLFGQGSVGSGGGLLRKLAHFTEFACLGIILRWLLGMLQKQTVKQLTLPLLLAFFVACIDETIQIFVPDRGPGFKDVLIDTAGATLGIVILTVIHMLKTKKRHS